MRARAVRMVLEHQGSVDPRSATVAAIAPTARQRMFTCARGEVWLHPRDIAGLGSAGGKGQRGTGWCDQAPSEGLCVGLL
jgi:hypothetical protein